jgi:hypothetical protein
MNRKRLMAIIVMLVSTALLTVGSVLVLAGLADVQGAVAAQNETMGLLAGAVAGVILILISVSVAVLTLIRTLR